MCRFPITHLHSCTATFFNWQSHLLNWEILLVICGKLDQKMFHFSLTTRQIFPELRSHVDPPERAGCSRSEREHWSEHLHTWHCIFSDPLTMCPLSLKHIRWLMKNVTDDRHTKDGGETALSAYVEENLFKPPRVISCSIIWISAFLSKNGWSRNFLINPCCVKTSIYVSKENMGDFRWP